MLCIICVCYIFKGENREKLCENILFCDRVFFIVNDIFKKFVIFFLNLMDIFLFVFR